MHNVKRQRLWLGVFIISVLAMDGAIVVGRAAGSASAAPKARVALTKAVPPTTEVPPPSPPTTTTQPNVAIPRLRQPVDAAGTPDEPILQIGMITIPRLGLNHPIFEGITLRNINNGPSHWPGTALPGEPGNTVFAGHRVTHSRPFRDIDQLVPGDEVIFDVNNHHSVYKVTGHDVVSPKDVWISNPTAEATGTLFACHPPGTKTYRYVVHLALVSTR